MENQTDNHAELRVGGCDLRRYLERFPEMCRKKYGRTYNFRHLEKRYTQLREGKRWLVARDVLTLFDPAETPFTRLWQKPNEKELDQSLKPEHLYLAPAPGDARLLVERLSKVLRNPGVVSLVLRFVHPDRYAILGPNAVHLLQIQRPTPVELYVAFCRELKIWQEHFKLPSVAETEMALWTYYEFASAPDQSEEASRARQEFDGDVWIQRRRVAQVLRPFLQKYGNLELARILAEEHPKLAGKIAGEEYERLQRAAARQLRPPIKLGVKGAVEIFLDRMEQDAHISLEEKTLLRRIWEIRNMAVHAGSPPSTEEVELMIDCIERICRKWERMPAAPNTAQPA